MRSLTDEAVVVGVMDYREKDKIVHLYTKEHGRVSGVARGAKKSVKRFGGALELFARLSINFLPGDSLVTIRNAEPLTIYPGIRLSLERICHASYAAELVSALTPEKYPQKRVFRLLCAYLEWLDSSSADHSDRHFFTINLLNILGYRPLLENCAGCGTELAGMGLFWQTGQSHGIYCERCTKGGKRLDAGNVSLLIESMKTGRFGQIRFNPEGIDDVDRFLEAFIGANIGRTLKSLAFLRLSP